MTTSLWQLDHVCLRSGRQARLVDVSVTIEPGATAVIGPSASGKTSLLNLLVKFEKPTSGRVVSHVQRGRFALPLYWVPHGFGLWPHLSVRGHFEAVAGSRKAPSPALPHEGGGGKTEGVGIDELLERYDLADCAQQRPGQLSQGQRSRLAVARCLAAAPAVMVLDEPLVHLDPARVDRYWQVVRDHVAATGCHLVYSTHNPEAVLADARRVICLDGGRVLYDGAVASLYHHPADEKLAGCLGPYNWFAPGQARPWLDLNGDQPRCLRPEQVRITRRDAAPLIVEQARFQGSIAEVQLRHQPTQAGRTILHRPASPNLKPGDRVELTIVDDET